VKNLILTNVVNIFVLIGVCILKIVCGNLVFLIGMLGWLCLAIYTNYDLLIKSKDLMGRLKSANKHGMFRHQVSVIEDSYLAIEHKSEFFMSYDESSSIRKAYDLLQKQMLSNLNASVKYLEGYDYRTRPSTRYIDNICRECEELVSKLNDLSELVASIDDSASDVDVTYVDDLIKSLRSVQNNEEE